MRTIVFGAGALGCYLAHALVKAGNDVCVTDHCRAATTEMRAIDEDFMALVETLPGRRMPTWDALRAEMPGWDELEARWNRKANEEAPCSRGC